MSRLSLIVFFFFSSRRRHTRYWRDWSSDVCSSDLVYSGIAINTDKTKGVLDRFRSLPIWRPSPLVGALLGDCVRYLAAATVIVVLGLILGFRPENGVPGVLAAVGLVVLFSFALSWVFTTMGLLMRSPNAVMNAGFMSIFPITFLSNTYVEPETLPK